MIFVRSLLRYLWRFELARLLIIYYVDSDYRGAMFLLLHSPLGFFTLRTLREHHAWPEAAELTEALRKAGRI